MFSSFEKKALGSLDKTQTLPPGSLEAALALTSTPTPSWDLLSPSAFLPGSMPSYLAIQSRLPLTDPFLPELPSCFLEGRLAGLPSQRIFPPRMGTLNNDGDPGQ